MKGAMMLACETAMVVVRAAAQQTRIEGLRPTRNMNSTTPTFEIRPR
jgi:hypothetical protein